MTNSYEEPEIIDKPEFKEIVTSDVVANICGAIVRAVHYIDDYDWLLRQYKLLLDHPENEVRGATVTCIGHLSRLNEKANKNELLQTLKPYLTDEKLAGRVEDAMDDINTFL